MRTTLVSATVISQLPRPYFSRAVSCVTAAARDLTVYPKTKNAGPIDAPEAW